MRSGDAPLNLGFQQLEQQVKFRIARVRERLQQVGEQVGYELADGFHAKQFLELDTHAQILPQRAQRRMSRLRIQRSHFTALCDPRWIPRFG
jgi:hypothetical protein